MKPPTVSWLEKQIAHVRVYSIFCILHLPLWRLVLVPILFLGGIDNLLVLGDPSSLFGIQALSRVKEGGRRDMEASLHGRTGPKPEQPGLYVGKLVVRDTDKREAVDPANQGNVCDAVLAAPRPNDVVTVGQPGVEDAVEAFGLANVALDGVGDLLLGKANKVVRLALHGANASVLPADPRVGACVVVRVNGEGKEVLGVIAPCQVPEDGVALEDGQVVVVVVHNGRDAAIGVDGSEPRLLLDVLRDVDALVRVLKPIRLLELLEQDAGLDAIGCACLARIESLVSYR